MVEWTGATAHKRKASEDPLEEYDESNAAEGYKSAKKVRTLKAQPAMGEAYRGKKATRAQLGFSAPESDSSDSNLSDGDEYQDGVSEDVDKMDVDTSDEAQEGEFEISLGGDESGSGSEMEESMSDDNRSYGDEEEDAGDDEVDELERELLDEDENAANAAELQRLKEEASEELAKAQHALNQRVLWDALLDLRLKLQAPQSEMNRFPQFSELPSFLEVNEVALKRFKESESFDDETTHKMQPKSIEQGTKREENGKRSRRSSMEPKQAENDKRKDAKSEKNESEPSDDVVEEEEEKFESLNLESRLADTRARIRGTIGDLLDLQQTLIHNNEEMSEELESEAQEKDEKVSKRFKRFYSQISSDSHHTALSLSVEDLWSGMESYQKVLASHAEQTIDKWARKVLYASDNLEAQSKFKAVNQSISVQVDQIMSNKEKVIGRTRLKRDQFRVLGKVAGDASVSKVARESTQISSTLISPQDASNGIHSMSIDGKTSSQTKQEGAKLTGKSLAIALASTASDTLADAVSETHDPEIFDDGDFCQILLKEVLEAGMTDTSDPIEMTRRFLALRANRRSFNNKSERKPSKGKTLKYSEQQKLIAFMGPVPNRYPAHDAYVTSQLILSLFGKHPDWNSGRSAHDEDEDGQDSEEEIFSSQKASSTEVH